MSRAKQVPVTSLFDWAGVGTPTPVAPVAPALPAAPIAAPSELHIAPVVEPEPVHVPSLEPAATAMAPAGISRLRDSYAFVERTADGRYWTGRVRGEHMHASVLYTRDELVELRGRIDAALALDIDSWGRAR